jgi:HSP20 family protein
MSTETKEMTVESKKEILNKKEQTIPCKVYSPLTDIMESQKELLVLMDMPGVNKDQIKVKLEKNILEISGQINTAEYSDYKPIYTEYNFGNYTRSFELSNEIDQSSIKATIEDGVLRLVLPKVPEKQPKQIQVS